MKIDIDPQSGFCTGVKRAVKLAETEIQEGREVRCLGEIVHNQAEVERLSQSGLTTVSSDAVSDIQNGNILIRAHGEPPSTYEKLNAGKNKVIDGTCPVVIQVQKKVKKAYEESLQNNGKLIIYGKSTHPEVNGLLGQIQYDAMAVTSTSELEGYDFSQPIYLFSQTTMPVAGYKELQDFIHHKMQKHFPWSEVPLQVFDTICKQVANRIPQLQKFAREYQVVVFVGGANSSNGKVLFQACKAENPHCYFVSKASELKEEWFENRNTVGICGATSTPVWQMEEIKQAVENLTKNL
jgi:4-hydroxy-3-methylbut-2-enyl diphosphate reductase